MMQCAMVRLVKSTNTKSGVDQFFECFMHAVAAPWLVLAIEDMVVFHLNNTIVKR